MKITSTEIDKKVCSKKHAEGAGDASNPVSYSEEPTAGNTAQCSGLKNEGSQKFSDFVVGVALKDNKNWPTGRYYANTGTKVVRSTDNSNANAMAKDLVDLSRDEKTIVAGLLAKTIEGGEVVEIRAVSSTSVMVNSSGYTKLHHMM